ncbi:VanW family protein [Treponema sp.]|uniref:VanW family protein n=1 Tax=Treponema sp. TaxID=166 RepID=UPI00298DB479|nr:VanW family protein [Treponema sp.]MCR5614394.1 VanW family protein [Treponema sp.]
MSRRLFCEINPLFYFLSLKKEIFIRQIENYLFDKKIAVERNENEKLPEIVKSHFSILLRKLEGVDIQLQINKVQNIKIAASKLNGLLIRPGETFSFWKLVKAPSKRRGYKKGLVIKKNAFGSDYGGGLCQLANLIHFLVLNSPLTVTELHHHSDALFPDDRRRVPFGTGTSICYNMLDYRFKNTTDQTVQLFVWIENEDLCGELRCEKQFPFRYKIVEENHHFAKEESDWFRNSQIYKITIDRSSNKEIRKELILNNHSKVLYNSQLIPKDQIRQG